MTQQLLSHFKRMQEMATSYIQPEPYVDNEGRTHTDSFKDDAFIGDMIYMLDGPEQREAQARAELVASQGYPTEDAYMSTCRALHWRTEQLRQAGIEPLRLIDVPGAPEGIPHYPPDHFRFPIAEAFPGDDHRQIYHAWRRHPRAMGLTLFLGVILGAIPLTLLLVLR